MKSLSYIIMLLLNSMQILNSTQIESQIAPDHVYYCPCQWKAGTTTMVLDELKQLAACADLLIEADQEIVVDLEELMSNSWARKHYQQKISHIEASFLLIDSKQKPHYLIVNHEVIIDLSDKKEYHIAGIESKKRIERVISLYLSSCIYD